MTATQHTFLGGPAPREFMAKHWQKQWRLMRGALPAFQELIDSKALFALACSEDVESRLILRDGKTWTLENGRLGRLFSPHRRPPDMSSRPQTHG